MITNGNGSLSISQVGLERSTAASDPLRRHSIIASSSAMQAVLARLERIATSAASILIEGETGTGKELIAREIHRRSGRVGQFLAVNCAAIPHELLESMIFGHVRGAFTGAHKSSQGLLVAAHDGTFFFDEISGMPLDLQIKLLRTLQEREVLPIGAMHPTKINCRIIAATGSKLLSLVRTGQFRADLYYRLNVVDLPVPPLRERPEDIVPLTNHFIKLYASAAEPDISSQARSYLQRCLWPGNVRQLENAIERAVLLDEDGLIGPEDLPDQVITNSPFDLPLMEDELKLSYLDELEQRMITRALSLTEGSIIRAAGVLGVGRDRLRYRMKKYGLWSLAHERHEAGEEAPS